MVVATVVDAQTSDWNSSTGNKMNGNNKKPTFTNTEYAYMYLNSLLAPG
jgi:hypothetical protein